MNMPFCAARPPDTATVDGAPAGDPDGKAEDDSDGRSDSGTEGGVDGTTQGPSGPSLDSDGRPGPRDRDRDRKPVIGSAEWDLLTDGVRWNAETYLLLGCDPGHGPLSLDRLPDRLPEADRPLLRRMMTDALVHGRPAAGTLRIRRPGGRHHSVECAGEPVLGADGTVTALRMLLRPAPAA
ncbi:PAS domain-containing protein [Kitasatospora aureofaciens]|uniref:PAS domain-containing protein n=1 Tax=Kitasatospora aureofaciens TaxID=1894 RepID=UPI001E0B1CB5|nr:PAS domain-containing protein [Kitasatospora aureofaciens]HJD80600.1 PAS domain-containing protein [Kitasatospora aureofaciens]